MSALVVGIVCAIVTGVALFGWFRRTEKDAPDLFSPDYVFITDPEHLRESVRLAELKIKEINEATATLEKKAVLLITLCALLLTYLGAQEYANAAYEFIKGAAFVFLTISAVIAAKAVEFGRQGAAGLNPEIFAHYAKNYNDRALELAHRYLLDKYQSIINKADNMHKEKSKIFRNAKVFLIIGFSLALAWIIADFSAAFGAAMPAQSK